MAETVTPEIPPPVPEIPPLPEPPPPPRVGDPYWSWWPSTKFMVGGNYDVGIGSDSNSA